MNELALVLAIVAILFVALPGMVLHYITEWKKNAGLKPDDERMLEDIWRSARAMERRIDALEAILDEESPEWRRTARRERER